MDDTLRARAERNALPNVGAQFFRADGEVKFQFVIDSGNIIGPRTATRADQDKHAGAWAAFAAAEGADGPLDRDASGAAGGSLPTEVTEDAADAAVLDAALDAQEAGTLETAPHAEVIATVTQVAPRSPRRSTRRG